MHSGSWQCSNLVRESPVVLVKFVLPNCFGKTALNPGTCEFSNDHGDENKTKIGYVVGKYGGVTGKVFLSYHVLPRHLPILNRLC